MSYTEENYENAILQLFEKLGYEYVYGPSVERDYSDPLFDSKLRLSLCAINPNLPIEAIDEAIYKIRNFESNQLEIKNSVFCDYLQNGVEVSYRLNNEQKYDKVNLVDYDNIENNSFIVSNQWTFVEHSEKRADIIVFLNGIPLVIIELKSPSREETDASAAYRQLQNYMREIPSIFAYNAFCVMSDMAETKAGTITASEDRYMAWESVDGSYETTKFADYKTFFAGIFERRRFLDVIRNFICFLRGDRSLIKILAAYHQYFAVNRALESTLRAVDSNGKAGVFWHTQGSGKSLSMVFYANLLRQNLKRSTIVVITDRNDLDDQLFGQFAKCSAFLRQTPQQAASRQDLKELLKNREANGIIFTTMQKFTESEEPLSERKDIIVMADEAHRGHYEIERIDPKSGEVKISTEILIRRNLPNATYIGFTGTPISQKDRNTREVFGDYIDIYDMTQAVEDGATRPVYYESRVVRLKLDKSLMDRIDREYDKLAKIVEDYSVEKSKKELSRMDSILGAEQTIDALCRDIVIHYEQNRANILTGKAMIVAYSREIAMKIYKKILALRPNWNEKIALVMTSSNNDPKEWGEITGKKSDKEELARKFKDNDSPLKIAIVVDMWLTGFDVPSLATMYVYKPMEGHNLMQAIARVNRVFKDKEGGLIVDYVGIASALKKAMNDYTARDKERYGDMDISDTALPRFLEKLEVCRDLFHGFDYSSFKTAKDYDRAQLIMDGVNFLSDPQIPERKKNYIKEAMLLRQALSLCRSIASPDDRMEAAFFEAVRTLLTRITSKPNYISLREINARINELLRQSIKSEGVVNLFSDVKEEFSIFDPKFLVEVAWLKQKNLAVELLKKLIAEQVSVYQRTNVVKSQKFSELLQKTMRSYLNGLLTNEEVIQELLKMAREIVKAKEDGNALGLTTEESAFYDALAKPQAVKDFYSNEQLVAITKELTEALRKNKTIDWQKKQTARARMRLLVKRLLKKYKYPPEGQEEALNIVIAQCEMWTDNNDMTEQESA